MRVARRFNRYTHACRSMRRLYGHFEDDHVYEKNTQ